MDGNAVIRAIEKGIACKQWAKIFKQALNTEGSSPSWNVNISDLYKNTKLRSPDVAIWDERYGLWPGQTLALFASHSRWVHLSTNTLPFYNVFPRLEGQFPGHINVHADDLEGPMTHWMHDHPQGEPWRLSQAMARWLRWHDGSNVLLADKSEAGWYYLPDRGVSYETGTPQGEYNPEHVHHSYLYTNEYELSRQARGKEAAGHGTFLPVGQFSPEGKQ